VIFINTKIKIIDSIMGSGKTSYAIQKMIEDTQNNYIYITPFLTEVQRIKDQCKDRKFMSLLTKGLVS
jgi:Zn-dependent alcohol dehydrogenase